MESSVSASVLVPHTCFTDISQHPPSTCNMLNVIRAFIKSQLGPFVFARPKEAEWFKKNVLNGSRLSLYSSSESGGSVVVLETLSIFHGDHLIHLIFYSSFNFFHQDELHNSSTSFLRTLLNISIAKYFLYWILAALCCPHDLLGKLSVNSMIFLPTSMSRPDPSEKIRRKYEDAVTKSEWNHCDSTISFLCK